MSNPQIQILLSTYNGEAFLKEQVQSILDQTFEDWQLIIRDDGSSDGTIALIESLQKEHPEKIKQIQNNVGGGSSQSFIGMLDFVEAPYCMFCDQDDYWEPNKIELSLSKLKEIEKKNPVAAVFTDMEVVSADLKQHFGSFLKLQKLKPEWIKNSNNILAQSIAAGCTMIFTKKLIEILKPIKAPLFQHDQWLMINAALYGEIAYCPEKTIKYRQHSYNAVGSHAINLTYFSKKSQELSKVIQRWIYLKEQFSSKVNIFKLFIVKLKLNFARL